MKKYIKSAQLALPYRTIMIDIVFDYADVAVAASKIYPVKQAGLIDDQALSDYLAFIQEVISEIEDAGLVIIEERSSKSSETSKYYTLADDMQYAQNTMKYVIFLRISDHVPQLTADQQAWVNDVRNATKHKYGVKWKVRYITVNESTNYSYEEAIEEFKQRLVSFKQALSK